METSNNFTGGLQVKANRSISDLVGMTDNNNIFEACVLGAIGLTGTLGNLTVILTFAFILRLSKPIHIIILSLAFADFLTCAVYAPAYGYGIISTRWLISSTVCTAAGSLFLEQLGVTTMTNLLIAVYSYLSYFHPQRCTKWFTKKHVVAYVIVIWITAGLLLTYPVFLDHASIQFDDIHLICQIDFPDDEYVSQMVYIYLNTLVIYLVPLFVSGLLYSSLASSLCRYKYIPETDDNSRVINRTVVTMCLVYIMFIVCWVPHLIVLNFESSVNSVLFRSTTYLLILNSCLNPFIYGFRLPDFQNTIKDLCPACLCRKEKHRELQIAQTITEQIPASVEMV